MIVPTIAFVMESFYGDHIGGAERQVQLLGQALREAGWQTVYICERDRTKVAAERVDGMEVLALAKRKKRWTWRNYYLLRLALERSRADLFYQRVRHPYTGLTALAAHRLKKPFIWAAASTADVIRREDLRFASYSAGPLDRLLHPLNRQLENWGIRKADAIILQTREQRELLQANYRREGIVLPNHLHLPGSETVEKRQPAEILWISNIKPFKRPELFLQLAERCQDLPAQFSMAGNCPDANTLQTIQGAQFTLRNFNYLGALEPTDAEKRIAAATLLINTSRFEGFPNAFQQAWYYGVPTLSLGVNPDGIIAREKLGYCAGNIEELERELRRFLRDDEGRGETGWRASAFARREYDLAKLLPKYLDLFNKLISV